MGKEVFRKGTFYGDLFLKDLRVDGAGFTNFLRMPTTDSSHTHTHTPHTVFPILDGKQIHVKYCLETSHTHTHSSSSSSSSGDLFSLVSLVGLWSTAVRCGVSSPIYYIILLYYIYYIILL